MNNLKKMLIVFVISIFLFSTIVGNFVVGYEPKILSNNNDIQIKEYKLIFSNPQIIDEGEYVNIEVKEATTTLRMPYGPSLPVIKNVYEFPFGTIFYDIEISYSEIVTKTIEKTLKPVPEQKILTSTLIETKEYKQNTLYGETDQNSQNIYPNKWFDYEIKVGRNKNMEKTAFLILSICPVQSLQQDNQIKYINSANIKIEYSTPQSSFSSNTGEDLLIITAPAYKDILQDLVTHKQSHGISTKLVSTDEINTDGVDLAEKIKKFIYEEDIPYVLLVGGYRSFFGLNKPELQIPLRWICLEESEPGYVSDYYYSDTTYYDQITKEYKFDNWDSNNNGKYGEDSWTGYDDLDLMPDVALGRLAGRNEEEVTILVNKIIIYENTDNTNTDWFNRIMTATGDDFVDYPDWEIYWDTNGLSGEYQIHAQTTNCDNLLGNEHIVTITINHNTASEINMTNKDYTLTDRDYPYEIPIAWITVPSDGNILGYNDVKINSPIDAYEGERWTPIEYMDKVIGIKGKSYDPRTQGGEDPRRPYTTVHIWITKDNVPVINADWVIDSSCFFEGEWQAQHAVNYFPDTFEVNNVWTSNGKLHGEEPSPLEPLKSPKVDGQKSFAEEFNKGYGFVYACGHASPISWADHYPGIPGPRSETDVAGMKCVNTPKSISDIFHMFPLDELIKNGDKLPVMVICGCHPLALDCSLIKALADPNEVFGSDFGKFGPESLGEWITRLEDGGSIATIGQTALGTGTIGENWLEGAGTQYYSEGFFRILNQENLNYLGDIFKETQVFYLNKFSPLSLNDKKTLTENILLGDPTLKIGGYPSTVSKSLDNSANDDINKFEVFPEQIKLKSKQPFINICDTTSSFSYNTNEYQVTTSPFLDKKPETFTTDGNNVFIAGYAKTIPTHSGETMQDGFAVSDGGAEWAEYLLLTGDDQIVHQSISYTGYGRKCVGTDYNAIGSQFNIILMDDILDPSTWEVQTHYITSNSIFDFGRNGVAITGGYKNEEFTYIGFYFANITEENDNLEQVPIFVSSYSNYVTWFPNLQHASNSQIASDKDTGNAIFAFETEDNGYIGHIEIGGQYGILPSIDLQIDFTNPDIDYANDIGIIVFETAYGIQEIITKSEGLSWDDLKIITSEGEKPEIVANSDGTFDCYYIKNSEIYKKHGILGGVSNSIQWGNEEKITAISNLNSDDIFDAIETLLIYPKTDGNLYIYGELEDIQKVKITDFQAEENILSVKITNVGTTTINEDWTIEIKGVNPLVLYGFPDIIKGKIFKGKQTTGTITNLEIGESTIIKTTEIKGILWVDFIVTVGSQSETEDGFLAWNKVLITHPRE